MVTSVEEIDYDASTLTADEQQQQQQSIHRYNAHHLHHHQQSNQIRMLSKHNNSINNSNKNNNHQYNLNMSSPPASSSLLSQTNESLDNSSSSSPSSSSLILDTRDLYDYSLNNQHPVSVTNKTNNRRLFNVNRSTPPPSTTAITHGRSLVANLKTNYQQQQQQQQQRDSGFIDDRLGTSLSNLNDEEPIFETKRHILRKPPAAPPKSEPQHLYKLQHHTGNYAPSANIIHQHYRSLDDSGLEDDKRRSNHNTKSVNFNEHTTTIPNTVLFTNDENSFMSNKEMNEAVVKASPSGGENRKFAQAMQKASLIENKISKKCTPSTPTTSTEESRYTTTNRSSSIVEEQHWTRRQTNGTSEKIMPPPSPSVITTTNDCSFQREDFSQASSCPNQRLHHQSSDLNSDEYQFFINAIEKLKATNLFHEEDIKRMTDEQIYDALVEHARKQKLKQRLIAQAFTLPYGHNVTHHTNPPASHVNTTHASNPTTTNILESIDKEDEEDLPIIMKNLHSVKSLKHFFEIRAKSTNTNSGSGSNSPVLNPKSDRALTESSSSNKRPNSLQELFMKSNSVLEKSIKHGMGVAGRDVEQPEIQQESTTAKPPNVTECNQQQSDQPTTTKSLPVPPPLPDFLTQPFIPQTKFSLKTRNGTLSSTHSGDTNVYMSSKELIYNQDLHEKLIKEIHNKSLERSKKDTSIFLDEHGNLINRPSNRVYSSNIGSQFKLSKFSKFNQHNHHNTNNCNAFSNLIFILF